LDFGTILAATSADGPSVIQLRVQDPLPETTGRILVGAIRQFEEVLKSGALIVIDKEKLRARILPLKPE
jgi:predicted nuclease of predicted toxin-antitoxin system